MTRGVGAAAFEKSGIIHWWTNKSSKKARVLVVDIRLLQEVREEGTGKREQV